MNTPRLESDKIYLIPLTELHCNENYLSWFGDPEAVQYIESAKQTITLDSLKEFVRKNQAAGNYLWAIHEKESHKHVGNLKIDAFDVKKRSAEYGILVGDRGSWGKGYAREASERVIDFCFSQLKLEQLTLGFVEGNDRAEALYKKLGFEPAETVKNYGEYNGKMKNVIRMRLTATKWRA